LDNAEVENGATESSGFPSSALNGDVLVNSASVAGTIVVQPLGISSVSTLFASSSTLTSLGDLTVNGELNDSLSATLITQFGSLSFSDSVSGASYQNFDGENTIVLTGSIESVNKELAALSYTSNSAAWDDSIQINVSDSTGDVATRYIPVIVNQQSDDVNAITTIAPGFINTAWLDATFFPGQTFGLQPTINGSMIVASDGDSDITMGASISIVLLGSGDTTLTGGDNQEYISTGSGDSVLDLDQGGDITIAGGSGKMAVNAQNGKTLIQAGASDASIIGGNGELTVVGGLGNTTFLGGNGTAYLTTLPADSGQLVASLGTGNSTVLAFSGDDTISSLNNTSNSITFGTGDDSISSFGDDTISAGSGNTTVHSFLGSSDTINLGSGMLTFIDDTNPDSSSNAISQGYASLTTIGAPVSIDFGGLSAISGSDSPIYISAANGGKQLSVTGSANISDNSTSDTVLGGTGDLNFTGGFYGSTNDIIGGAGSSDVVFNGGVGTVQAGAGDTTVMASATKQVDVSLGSAGGNVVGSATGESVISTYSNANDIISAGQPNSTASEQIQSFGLDQISVGGHATINGMSGSNDTITVSGGSLDDVVGAGGQYSDASATVNIDSGFATISAMGMSSAFVSFSGFGDKLDFINGSILSQSVIAGNMDSITVSGGAGGGIYQGGSMGDNSLVGGSGADTFIGGGSGDYLSVNSGSGQNMLISGVGRETLTASASTNSNIFDISPGSNDHVSSSGSGIQSFFLEGASGDAATLTGSQATGAFNLFDVVDDNTMPGGVYSITNFSPDNSIIYICNSTETGGGPASISEIQPENFGLLGGTNIMLSNNTQISLIGISPASLSISHLSNGIIAIQ